MSVEDLAPFIEDRRAGRFAKELLPALDHLELALKAAEGHEDVVKGFAMVAGEIQAALARVGIQAFSPKGEAFDPNEHEAMAQQPVDGAESGTIVEVFQSGYRLGEDFRRGTVYVSTLAHHSVRKACMSGVMLRLVVSVITS